MSVDPTLNKALPQPPQATKAARQAAIDAALAAYDKKFVPVSQGSGWKARLMGWAGIFPAPNHGITIMKNSLRGAVAICALIVAGVTTLHVKDMPRHPEIVIANNEPVTKEKAPKPENRIVAEQPQKPELPVTILRQEEKTPPSPPPEALAVAPPAKVEISRIPTEVDNLGTPTRGRISGATPLEAEENGRFKSADIDKAPSSRGFVNDKSDIADAAKPRQSGQSQPAIGAAGVGGTLDDGIRQKLQLQTLKEAQAGEANRKKSAESTKDARLVAGLAQQDRPADTTISPLANTAPATIDGKATESYITTAEPVGRDKFTAKPESPFHTVQQEPVSTFSLDVDTTSYGFTRASLARNVLPQKNAVRTEEMINYFPYKYPAPTSEDGPFKTTISVMPSPWNEGRQLVHIGIKGAEIGQRPKANLVFLIDTSGSMSAPNRLPLAKQALAMFVQQLQPTDVVGIVTYAGEAGIALQPTSDKASILAAIGRLNSEGSTAGAEGIRQAYELAEAHFDPQAVNRIMLATDGDFNVGITSSDELKSFIERKRDSGIYLSVLGFGMGNYNDTTMQALAQNGNGVAAYIDTLSEARKTLVDEATSTIVPIAKDVKIQIEFNPARVAEYRLVGYEKRALRREDFNNDKVDAGDVGSGHTVTAIYEIVPVGAAHTAPDLRYAPQPQPQEKSTDEIGFLSMRYKLPKEETSRLATTPIRGSNASLTFDTAPEEARFSVAVAGFAELLRGGRYTGKLTYDDVIKQALAARGEDPFGYRNEFVQMVRSVKTAAGMVRTRK